MTETITSIAPTTDPTIAEDGATVWTTTDVRRLITSVQELAAESFIQTPTIRSPRLSALPGAPRGGIERPLPGGPRTVILGTYADAADDRGFEADDTPVLRQTVYQWGAVIARLRYRATPATTLAASFRFLIDSAEFIAEHADSLTDLIADFRRLESALRRLVPATVDETHDDSPAEIHLPALAGAVPSETMLHPRDAEKFWPGVAAWIAVRRCRKAGFLILGEPDSQGRFSAAAYRAWDAYIGDRRDARTARTQAAA